MDESIEKKSKGKCTAYKWFTCCGPQKGRKQRKQPNEKRQKNVNCNSKNETILMEDVPPKEVTSPFKEETHSEEKNNDQINYENNDHIKYVNYLVEKCEKVLSYEIQQFKLNTNPSDTPLLPVQKSNKLCLPLDQHLLDNDMTMIYKKYLEEEFKLLMPYDDEETKHDTSSWTTSVLYSLPVRQSSKLRLLLNQPFPEKDRWHLPPMICPIDEMHPLHFLNSR